MFQKIVVAYNDSHEAERALRSAIGLAKNVNAELHAITVDSGLSAYTAYAAVADPFLQQVLVEDNQALSGSLQAKARSRAHEHGIDLISHQVGGREVYAIIKFLRDHKADLLVVGLHPRDLYISRLWSTVYELAQDAPCSVLGVR